MAITALRGTKEWRNNITKALKGRKPTYGFKDKKHSIKSKEKISQTLKGHKDSKKTIEKRRKSLIKTFKRQGGAFFGKHHTKKAKKKISRALKGRKPSKKARKAVSKYLKERNRKYGNLMKNPKAREKMSKIMKGREIKWKDKISKTLKGRFIGKKNPAWQGGKSFEPYGKEFNDKLKERIRKRDGYKCKMCKIPQEKLNRKLDIHHIDGDKKNNNPKNLVSLCLHCHRKIENGIRFQFNINV